MLHRHFTMKSLWIVIFIGFTMILSSCAREAIHVSIKPGMPEWEISKKYAYAYERSRARGERIAFAEDGIEHAKECIRKEPQNPACYYYHAVNLGHYYQSKVIGYQDGLKEMIQDCNQVNRLDPGYAHGGGYRIMGQIYTEVPAISLKRNAIVRDLDKAISLLLKANEHGPDYPENFISLAKAYLKADEKEKAAIAVIKAKRLMPEWRGHDDYNFWKKDLRKLSKKLNSHIKNLQLSKVI